MDLRVDDEHGGSSRGFYFEKVLRGQQFVRRRLGVRLGSPRHATRFVPFCVVGVQNGQNEKAKGTIPAGVSFGRKSRSRGPIVARPN
jgi:hypothetical protein